MVWLFVYNSPRQMNFPADPRLAQAFTSEQAVLDLPGAPAGTNKKGEINERN
jgi:hypothetical protein